MEIIVKGATEEFAEKLVRLAAEHDTELSVTTVRPGWTVDRAERYLRDLTAGARRMAKMVIVDGDGYIDADQLRAELGRLNGPSNGLNRAVPRGVRKGWWPEGTQAPITPVSDPDNPSWHETIAYRMDQEIVPVFREAFTRITIGKKNAEEMGITPGGTDEASSRGNTSTTPCTLIGQDGGPIMRDGDPQQPAGSAWDGDAPSGLAVPSGWAATDDAPRVMLLEGTVGAPGPDAGHDQGN